MSQGQDDIFCVPVPSVDCTGLGVQRDLISSV